MSNGLFAQQSIAQPNTLQQTQGPSALSKAAAPHGERLASSDALLWDTVSLSPVSPINTSYEHAIANFQTRPGPCSRELFSRGISHEPLVALHDYGIDGTSYYAISNGSNAPYGKALSGANPTVYARSSVAQRLQQVNARLRPYGYELYVRDGWRSPLTQPAIFPTFEKNYLDQHPSATQEDARAHALRYASDPTFSADDPMSVPIHASGGAVDVTLEKIGSQSENYQDVLAGGLALTLKVGISGA